MDIINVVSVTAKADVKQWIRDSDGMENDLYWRQAIDARNLELSVSFLLPTRKTQTRMLGSGFNTQDHGYRNAIQMYNDRLTNVRRGKPGGLSLCYIVILYLTLIRCTIVRGKLCYTSCTGN